MNKANYRVVFSSDHISHAVTRDPDGVHRDWYKTKIRSDINDLITTLNNLGGLGFSGNFDWTLKNANNDQLNRIRSIIIAHMNKSWQDSHAERDGVISFQQFQDVFLKQMKAKGYDCYALLNDPKFFSRGQSRGR